MDVLFINNKLRKNCCETKQRVRCWGDRQAALIHLRLDELRDAETLEVMRTIPAARCHELTGKSRGRLSVDLEFPYRLVFEPADDEIPKKPDGGLDWSRVRTIQILRVENTHEKRRKSE